MLRPRPTGPLTDEKNEPYLSTLTSRAWRGLAVEEVAAEWWSFDSLAKLDELIKKNPSRRLVTVARRTSGSIGGAHRSHIRDALVGAPTVLGAAMAGDKDDGGDEGSPDPM